ncbi:MAG: IclR family transcriptional regulator [Thermomicrobiales bacterium]|nr:IclR family transcriptional regulator [Thermomicrobiales bacterium]
MRAEETPETSLTAPNGVGQPPDALLRSAGNLLAVLACFSVRMPSWTLTELSREAGLPKSTVFRILATLEAHNFLLRDEQTGAYRPTMRLWEIGAAALVVNGLHEAAHRFLPRLSERTGETAYATILDGRDAVHVDVYVARSPVRLHADVGDRFPAHTVASGKVLLAALPDDAVEAYIHGGLPEYTDRTLTDPQGLRDELAQVRRQGYALNRGERQHYVVGAGAPVRDHSGAVIAAIAAAGPSIRVTDDVHAVGRVVREVADEMSLSLGCSPQLLGNRDIEP